MQLYFSSRLSRPLIRIFISSVEQISTYCETTDYTVEGAVGGNSVLKEQIQCPGSSQFLTRYRYASNIPWLKAG